MLWPEAGEKRGSGCRTKIRRRPASPECGAFEEREAVSTAERIGLRAVEGNAKFVEQAGAKGVVPRSLDEEISAGGGRYLPGGDTVLSAGVGVRDVEAESKG